MSLAVAFGDEETVAAVSSGASGATVVSEVGTGGAGRSGMAGADASCGVIAVSAGSETAAAIRMVPFFVRRSTVASPAPAGRCTVPPRCAA